MREIITFEAKGGALPFLAMDFAMKRLIALLFILVTAMGYGSAQIGYQVALINNATGEPRALETVAVDVEISNSAGVVIATSRQSATTNELGLLSLTVGDSDTFANVDWTKLPLFISATVDGTLIGKTQILSVPVAEYAKHTGELTVEKLCSKTWSSTTSGSSKTVLKFNRNGKGHYDYYFSDGTHYGSHDFIWEKQGNEILVKALSEDIIDVTGLAVYFPKSDCLLYGHYTLK